MRRSLFVGDEDDHVVADLIATGEFETAFERMRSGDQVVEPKSVPHE